MRDVHVAPVVHDDLRAVGAIHMEAFPESAITSLGPEATRRYYAWLLDGPHDAKLMGAWVGGSLVGFCAAGVFRGALNGFLRKNRRYLAWHVATHPALWLSPLVRDRVRLAARVTFRFSRRLRRAPTTAAQQPGFGVLAIATATQARGTGAGRALMLDAEARARAQGFATMNLTVHPSNERAVRFYEQLGWTRSEHDGVWTGSMRRTLWP